MPKSKYLLHPHKLAVFAAVAQHQSITLAADHLNMTQPAVSNLIHQLENHFGIKLFEIHGKKLQITNAGKDLVHHWHNINAAYQNLEDEFRAQASGEKGKISVAILPGLKYLIPQIILKHREKFPHAEFDCHLLSREDLMAGVLEHKYDVGIINEAPTNPLLEKKYLGHGSHIFIASPQHALAAYAQIEIQQLQAYPFVINTDLTLTTRVLYRFFGQYDSEPKITLKINGVDAVKEAVIQNIGLALVPKVVCTRELASQLLIQLPIQSPLMDFEGYLISRKGRQYNKITHAFMECVVDFFK